MRTVGIGLVCLVALGGCGHDSTRVAAPDAPRKIEMSSPAFANGGTIPTRYTCSGEGPPPPLLWSGVPKDTKDLVLLVEDPDAPGGIFVHWVLPHIPVESDGLPPGGDGWRPPCPPEGDAPHHYRFSLYALGKVTTLTTESGGADAHKAIEAADPLARGLLVGRYGR